MQAVEGGKDGLYWRVFPVDDVPEELKELTAKWSQLQHDGMPCERDARTSVLPQLNGKT